MVIESDLSVEIECLEEDLIELSTVNERREYEAKRVEIKADFDKRREPFLQRLAEMRASTTGSIVERARQYARLRRELDSDFHALAYEQQRAEREAAKPLNFAEKEVLAHAQAQYIEILQHYVDNMRKVNK